MSLIQSHKTSQCPICSKKCNYHAGNRYRPFCSDRCKSIDLGEWASETRRIATETLDFVHHEVDFEI